jgi:SOS-response transcriptional repressors (RecA-mediated autopeptidases)
MTTDLTSIQERILNFIKESVKNNSIPPSIKEISANCGLSSSSSVHHQLNVLETKGYIIRDKTKSRAIKIKGKKKGNGFYAKTHKMESGGSANSIYDSVHADTNVNNHDFPLVSFDENLQPLCKDLYSLPLLLIGTKDAFLFRLESYELENLGIFYNDIVIIEYNDNPPSGEIVMAIANGKITIRTLLRQENCFILIPHNQKFMESKHEELIFVGVLKGLIRGKI